jgi:predicted nucleic acid-binding protein
LIVVDASLMTAWLLNEPVPAASGIYSILSDRPVIVPPHWPIEVSNALRTSLRIGRLGPTEFHDILNRLDLLRIEVEPSFHVDEIIPLAQFASNHDLTAYDAAYVQLALGRRFALATLDNAMRRAAIGLGIAVLPN